MYADWLDRMRALDPPEAVKRLHDENISVNRNLYEVQEARGERLQAATSLPEVEAILTEDGGFSIAVESADRVCNDFRDQAVKSRVDWDQPCQLD